MGPMAWKRSNLMHIYGTFWVDFHLFFVQCLDWWRNDPCFWCLWKYHANFGHRRWTSSPDLYSWNPSNHMVWWLSGLWVLANSTSEVFWKEVTRNLWNKKLYSDIYIYIPSFWTWLNISKHCPMWHFLNVESVKWRVPFDKAVLKHASNAAF